MATKRKSKHRGNAAGMIESRGRTGRRPTAAERGSTSAAKKDQKQNRLDKPPSWQGSFTRALVASVIVLAASAFFLKGSDPILHSAELFPLVLLIYVPMGYYTDRYMYERRQRKLKK